MAKELDNTQKDWNIRINILHKRNTTKKRLERVLAREKKAKLAGG